MAGVARRIFRIAWRISMGKISRHHKYFTYPHMATRHASEPRLTDI
jgi:hypothetical protein